MAKRRTKTARRTTSTTSHESSPSMIIQLGVVFIIVAAMYLAFYVGGALK